MEHKSHLGLVASLLALALILSVGTHLAVSQAYAVKELKTVSSLDRQAAEKKMKEDEKRKPEQKPSKTYPLSDIPAANKAMKHKHHTSKMVMPAGKPKMP